MNSAKGHRAKMGQFMAIETARARRALRNALAAPNVSTRIVRKRAPQANHANRARLELRSLSGWLWSAIRETLGERQTRMERRSDACVSAGKPEADR
jgi:hypothetical protein